MPERTETDFHRAQKYRITKELDSMTERVKYGKAEICVLQMPA